MAENPRFERWDRVYQEGQWDYLSHDTAELNRLQLAAGWIDRFGGPRVMDVGCGKGQLLALLNPRTVRAYVGIEASQVALQQRVVRDDIASEAHVWDIEAPELPQRGEFDCLCFIDVLQFAQDPGRIIRNYATLLPPDGVVITCHYVKPDRILAAPAPAEVMTAEPDDRIAETAVAKVLDSLTLFSMVYPRRWHMKVFQPLRGA